jgi:hypothetical protein
MDALSVDDVVRRIWAEYAEMPGLSLTACQGQRLWGVDHVTCVGALELLTTAGFLRKTAAGQYTRASDGPIDGPSLRMARADVPRPAVAPNKRAG